MKPDSQPPLQGRASQCICFDFSPICMSIRIASSYAGLDSDYLVIFNNFALKYIYYGIEYTMV